jgi:hypothetical protein
MLRAYDIDQVDEFTAFTERRSPARKGVSAEGEKRLAEQPVLIAHVDEFSTFLEHQPTSAAPVSKDAG